MPLNTVKQLLKEASKKIEYLDAELLLAHVLGKSREFLATNPEQTIDMMRVIKYKYLLKKRTSGMPLAYLTKHKEFYGFDFLVNKHTLIPRPDTEIMVEAVVNRLRATNDGQQIILIDVGTGSGCIPIAIAKWTSDFRLRVSIFATDISKQALKVTKRNAKKHNVPITFKHGNLLEPVLSSVVCNQLPFIITANLPYITEQQYQNSPTPEIHHEPKSALVADNNGLALYEELFKQIKQIVKCHILHITCYCEIDPSQSAQIAKLIGNILPETKLEIKKDLSGKDRVVIVSWGE